MKQFLSYAIICFFLLTFSGCNGLETDISKKPDFDIFISSFDSFESISNRNVDIPNHPEMSDFREYSVFPDPYRVNEISYQIRDITTYTTAQTVSFEVFYRNATLDTISLFEEVNVPLLPGERVDVTVSDSKLSGLSQLVNNQSGFLLIVSVIGDEQVYDFIMDIYFDTTITIDYDL